MAARGGSRPGAGRKPGPRRAVVLGMNGRRPRSRGKELPPAVSVEEKQGLLTPPDGLSPGAQTFWVRFAWYAVEERTLTPGTVAGFEQLAEQWAKVADLDARVRHLGTATREAGAALSNYIKLSQRLDSSMARFKLTAFGKPATSEKPKATAVNPWAQVAGQ